MTPTRTDELGRRLRAVLYVALAATAVFCALTALIVVSVVSGDRIESESRLRCRGDVQGRVETRRNLRTAVRRARANGVPADDTAIVVLQETRRAQPPKRCVKTDGTWTAQEVRQ